ncbi:hypothetical protein Tco_0919785, partial [Tanacetum coccineum]
MLEIITALAAEEAHSESTHSRAESSPRDAQGTPTQSAAQASILQDESQTFGGDEGLLDLYALNREVRRLKKQTISQAKQIHKLTAKLKKLSKGVMPLVKHHILWVKSQKLKKRGKQKKKKVSSVKLGRNKDEEVLQVQLANCKKEEPERTVQDDEFLADFPLNIKRENARCLQECDANGKKLLRREKLQLQKNSIKKLKLVRGWYNASYAGRKKISSIKRADDQDARS